VEKTSPALVEPSRHAGGTNPVTRDMVRARTRELALRAGREPEEATHADHAQAKRELTGESEWDRQEARLDAPPTATNKSRAGFQPASDGIG
jgi:hypothetical protein